MRILSSSFEAGLLHGELADFVENRSVSAGVPPSNNMGGTNCPPLSQNTIQKTRIDWLGFTSPWEIAGLKVFVDMLFDNVVFKQNDFGIPGYPESYSLTVDSVQVGVIGFGAKHGKNFVSITGKGCQLWDVSFYAHVREVLEVANASIRRIDICMDFYKGEVTYDQAIKAYEFGEFQLSMARKKPKFSKIESEENGVNLGRTMYVGSRKTSKMARIYEKGLEVFARLPDSVRAACTEPGALVYGPDDHAPEGTIADQWLRVEIEYKAEDVVLELDMITQGDDYFRAAYPFCERVMGAGDGKRPRALMKVVDLNVERVFLNLRNGYGNAIHTLKSCGYSDTQIIDRVNTGVQNQKMVKAGIRAQHQAVQDFDIPF